ncbi:PH domain-containing protein [Agreia sp. VKM Ac-1783]|uniref:PH domain-containing protein n=1 Tax=Agreia sp. VKM Ac-1783 TaxID=1938889 RepID=UPI000A2AEF11|nr:PH domain-containing protein [Agreia sp. VKM Ac-1783]SMQ70946.1 Host cell surface-exposed lipoprotein [Agreia sp. VKM Ac-1783]
MDYCSLPRCTHGSRRFDHLDRSKRDPDSGRRDPLSIQGEQAVAAFRTSRDSAVFTTKRLIVRDAQGITGKKVEIYTMAMSSEAIRDQLTSENGGQFTPEKAD